VGDPSTSKQNIQAPLTMNPELRYCPDLFSYQRRESREVMVGNVRIGGDNPIRIQSMITSDTRDVEASVGQVLDLAAAGCEIVRITAQTRKYAEFLGPIADQVRASGVEVPLVADIHFKPDAALEAAKWVEKIRVNPGNYADKKKFEIREYTDEQYGEELTRIREQFEPLVKLCQDKGRAMRIGTNHGSLSDRIMNRYGDTPLGMVESALEFARIARDLDYHQFVFSMKASNPKVMIEAYRLLVARLKQEGGDWNYPLHLGVTEAGDGEDGRIKSAIGIGSLLADGIGDTIRVSLTEDAVHEVPVAKALVAAVGKEDARASQPFGNDSEILEGLSSTWDPFQYERRRSQKVEVAGHGVGGTELMRVRLGDFQPEIVVEDAPVLAIDPRLEEEVAEANEASSPVLITVKDGLDLTVIQAFRLLASRLESPHVRLSYNVLQAAGARIFKTDYVACPSCGRTLFDLQETTQKIRVATGHLKGVRIAVMGCIVNGPGEMADADFGYVGGAPGKINLYVGKEAVKFSIPEAEAVERLVSLIKEHDRWVEPPKQVEEMV